jgi:hypothetical protein
VDVLVRWVGTLSIELLVSMWQLIAIPIAYLKRLPCIYHYEVAAVLILTRCGNGELTHLYSVRGWC